MASLKNNTATELSTEPGSVKRASAPDIPQHVLIEVFRYLPLDDLLNVSLVCKSWNAAANTDDVWKGQCQQCWASKVYVRLDSEGTWKKRFEASSRDGRRIEIKRAELCTFNWRFRLKMAAPQVLRMLDPWHLPNMNLLALGPEADLLQPPLLQRKFGPDGKLIAQPRDLLARYYEQWRFIENPEAGSVILLNTAFPALVARTADWGWRIETDDALYIAELTVDGPLKFVVESVE